MNELTLGYHGSHLHQFLVDVSTDKFVVYISCRCSIYTKQGEHQSFRCSSNKLSYTYVHVLRMHKIAGA